VTEPVSGPSRPTAMRLTTTLAVTAVAVLAAGCGQQDGSAASNATHADRIGSCATDASAVVHALTVHEAVDLDHDGVGNALMVTRPDSTCPNVMFSKVAGGYAPLELKGVRLDLRSAQRVVVPGRAGDLVAIREVHPRGGFQEHLYGYAGGRLAEVRTGSGDPPVPFVATDTKGGYVSTSCVRGGFVVRQAVTHKPPGVVFAWDVQETAYRLQGTTATAGGSEEIKDNVLDNELAGAFPDLVHRDMFTTGCGG
jgi:hypothetical protein